MMKELFEIQQRLVATKTNHNEFSNFNYRSLEDILQKAKPLLKELECVIKLTDEIVMLGDRFYVKSMALLENADGMQESAIGWAREPEEIKGMSAPQVSGTASSYARKYALASLLAIDDNKDIDSMDNRTENKKSHPQFANGEYPTWRDNKDEHCKNGVKQPASTKSSPLIMLEEWYASNPQPSSKDQNFYNYYKKKLESGSWSGTFNLEQAYSKWS